MINTEDPIELWAEVDKALVHTKDRLVSWDHIQKQWIGGQSFSEESDREDHENVVFGYGGWMIANLLHGQPRVEITSVAHSDLAVALEASVNRWIHQTNLRIQLEQSAMEHTLMWGVGVISNDEDPQLSDIPRGHSFGAQDGYTKPRSKPKRHDSGVKPSESEPEASGTPNWPTFQRIPQERYFRDPVALEVRLARFEGHKWIRTKQELLDEAENDDTWHKDILEEYVVPESLNDDDARANKEIPNRDEVEGHQIWVKDYELPDSPGAKEGYHGTIFTICTFPRSAETDADPKRAHLRDPIPFYGPPWGPYVHFGVFPVSNESFPLSPIVSVFHTVKRLNRVDKAIAQGAEDFKVPIVYDLKDAHTAQALQSAGHGQFIGVPNFNKDNILMGHPIGGISEQQLVWRNDTRALVDRVLGFTDMQRGIAGGKNTATADALAAGNADVRAGYVKQKWMDSVSRLITTVAWYIAMDESIFVPLEGEAAQALGVPKGVGAYFQGGDLKPKDWARIDLQITPFSMERTDEGTRQRRAQELAQMYVQLPMLIAQFPMMEWSAFIRWYGDMMNMPDLQKLLPPETVEALAQMGGMQAAQQQQGSRGASTGSDLPRDGGPGGPEGGPGLPGNLAGAAAVATTGVEK